MCKRKTLLAATALIALVAASRPNSSRLELSDLPRVATVDERFQSYNVEMVEVTGGKFWAPYGGPANEVYRQRPPIDLSNPKLIALAKGLAPSLMRVSGTWANNTYLEAPGENLTAPPVGFAQVMTRDEWRNVVAFSKTVDAPIVTSFAVSTGTRNADGIWTTDQAQRRVDLTKEAGGHLYAAEFINEPNIPGAASDMPKGYTAEDFGNEFKIFHAWARANVPSMKILGPGTIGMGVPDSVFASKLGSMANMMLSTSELAASIPGSVDAVSYHFYGSVSQRCAGLGIPTAQQSDALTGGWLDKTLLQYEIVSGLRDKYDPGKPLWITETAQAACGGSPWASTFLDTFRYLNQLGALAQKGVKVVMHDTLASSDYALIDGDTMTPRPNYWAAVLWRRVMGTTVLASPKSPSPALRLYAHCLRGVPGGVGVMALNTGSMAQTLAVGRGAQSWTMTGQPVDTRSVLINGKAPGLTEKGELTGLDGVAVGRRGTASIPGQSVAFFAVPDANNPVCW